MMQSWRIRNFPKSEVTLSAVLLIVTLASAFGREDAGSTARALAIGTAISTPEPTAAQVQSLLNISAVEGNHFSKGNWTWSSPDGKSLFYGADFRVKLQHVSRQMLAVLNGPMDGALDLLSFSRDGKWLVTICSTRHPFHDGIATLWNVALQKRVGRLNYLLGSTEEARFSTKGNTIMTKSSEGEIALWSTSGKRLTMDTAASVSVDEYCPKEPHFQCISKR